MRAGLNELKSVGPAGGWIQEVRGKGLLNAIVIDEKKSTKGRGAWDLCLLFKSKGLLAKVRSSFPPSLRWADADEDQRSRLMSTSFALHPRSSSRTRTSPRRSISSGSASRSSTPCVPSPPFL